MRTDLSDDEHWYLNYVNMHSDEGRVPIVWSVHGDGIEVEAVEALVERGLIEKVKVKKVRDCVWIKTTHDGILLARFYGKP